MRQHEFGGAAWLGFAAALWLPLSCAPEARKEGKTEATPQAPEAPGTVAVGAPEAIESEAAEPEGAAPRQWKLFDGADLEGWKVIDFAGAGEVVVEEGELILGMGEILTGVVIDGDPPLRMSYEISLEAKRVMGTDFFCGLTFPVGDVSVSFVAGGWGGGMTGISSVDGMDASENMTSSVQRYDNDKWYRFRVRVTPGLIEAWIDNRQVVNLATEGHRLGMRFGEIEDCVPLGLATYQTKAAIRNIVVQALD
jgi:hypothetical protein